MKLGDAAAHIFTLGASSIVLSDFIRLISFIHLFKVILNSDIYGLCSLMGLKDMEIFVVAK